jgi:hypothetical protein
MHLPDRRQTEHIWEGEIQENGVETTVVDVRQTVRERFGVRYLEFFDGPFVSSLVSDQSACDPAWYSSSLTFSIQLTTFPLSCS